MSVLLDNYQVEALVNHAIAVECCATLNVPFIMDDEQGEILELDPHTMKIGLQYVFATMEFAWPQVTQAMLQDFMDQNDIVGRADV